MKTIVGHNPPIDLSRGDGWDDATWAIHESVVQRSAKKADVGLKYVGITYDQWKVGLIHNARISRGEMLDLGGCALNAVNFLIYTFQTEDNKPRAVYNAAAWSSLTVHEVVHCARFERYSQKNDMVELAATEGLAYIAERAYIAKYCGKQLVPLIFDSELERPNPVFKEYLRAIADNKVNCAEALEWSKAIKTGHEVNNGSLIGAQLVHQQIEKGYTLPDLMNQPPEDILGL